MHSQSPLIHTTHHTRETPHNIMKRIKQHKNYIKALHLKQKKFKNIQTINTQKIDAILSIVKHSVGIPKLINKPTCNIYNKNNYINVANTFQQQQKFNMLSKNALNKQNDKIRILQKLTKPILLIN
eukprot:217643_1